MGIILILTGRIHFTSVTVILTEAWVLDLITASVSVWVSVWVSVIPTMVTVILIMGTPIMAMDTVVITLTIHIMEMPITLLLTEEERDQVLCHLPGITTLVPQAPVAEAALMPQQEEDLQAVSHLFLNPGEARLV